MAKKKTSPASKATPSAAKVTPVKKAAKPAPSLCCEEIGHTAGQVWLVLSEQGAQTAAALKKSVDAPTDLVMAAVGWLAREEKLDFTNTGRTVKISLR